MNHDMQPSRGQNATLDLDEMLNSIIIDRPARYKVYDALRSGSLHSLGSAPKERITPRSRHTEFLSLVCL